MFVHYDSESIYVIYSRSIGSSSFRNSSTSPLSVTYSEHGDNDNNNLDSPICDSSKPSGLHTVGGGRGDNPRSLLQKMEPSYAQAMKFSSPDPRGASPSLSSPDHVTYPQLGNPQSPDLCAQESPCFGPPASPPVEHMEELMALCLLGKIWGDYVPLPAIINKTRADWRFLSSQAFIRSVLFVSLIFIKLIPALTCQLNPKWK
ncbi:hypothetical protein Cgig2_020592 [Carnegiea gigantea]|uniref:Uncharacterized protein n=1 Tax=Carnegiea gigantea TaxID=171969 RepID=A0A9Q1Q9F1_9CARY|nr:hypothetical protein Cgig2_020592 [Carnegiea gigantea]